MAAAMLSVVKPKDVTLGKLLGAGGFGSVYKASHVNWGTVAVKQLKGVTLTDSIRKEAEKMWRAISSPYLVRIMGIVQDPTGLGIVMEYFENGSLKDFQQKYMKCECWSRKVKMIQDVAFGMNYLHNLKPPIIHRDLKVENLFVGDGFQAKIGDLGLAVSSNTSRQVSRVSGTRSHIPPEASTNPSVEPDEFWDIYTFAITTYEITSGKDAWPQQQKFANDALISVWVVQGHRPNLEAIPADAPEKIVDVIKQCWVAEPKERPSFQEILKTVTEVFEKKYRGGIRKADRAIFEQMDLVHESTDASDHSSAADSGVDSFWGKFESMDIGDASKGATSTDSGIGSASSIDPAQSPPTSSSRSTSLSRQKDTKSPTPLSAGGTTRPSNAKGTNKPPPPLPPKKQAGLSRAPSTPKAAGIGKTPEILKTVTEVFEKKYRGGIRKADRAIFEQMDLVHESTDTSDHSSAADSGVDSFWGKFESMDIGDASKGATSTDSGIGSASSIDPAQSLPGPSSRSTSFLRQNDTLSPTPLSAEGTTRPSNAKGTNKPPPPLPPKKQAGLSRAPSTPKAAGIGKTPGISIGSQHKPTDTHNMREWRLVKEFGVEGDGEGEFRLASRIAVCHNGDIAVTNLNLEKRFTQLYFFSKDGAYKSALKSHTTDPTGKLIYPTAVAVTSQGHLVVADQKKYVKLVDVTGSFLHSICTLTPDENPNTKVGTVSVAVSPEDDIIVGDTVRRLVTIHTQADGWAPRKVKLPITPYYLATNSQRHLLVSSWKERKVIALSMDGEVLFSMDGFCVDGKTGLPMGFVCDSNDDIYIAVMKVNEKTGNTILGTGHIHQYDNTGVFLRCIAKGLYRPMDMTMHNGSLYVVNKKSVLIYST